MIIKARHHWFFYPFFKVYSRWMPTLDFSRITLHSELIDRGLPILLIGNHISWWDGFLAQYVNLELFNRKLYIMMLEEQLRKRMFLNKTGAFSIKKGARSALESLRYAAGVLSEADHVLVLFPQGKIHSMLDIPVVFEKGWFRIFDYIEQEIQVIFFVSMVDYFSSRKPSLNIYVQDYPYQGKSLEELNRAYNDFLFQGVQHQKSLA